MCVDYYLHGLVGGEEGHHEVETRPSGAIQKGSSLEGQMTL